MVLIVRHEKGELVAKAKEGPDACLVRGYWEVRKGRNAIRVGFHTFFRHDASGKFQRTIDLKFRAGQSDIEVAAALEHLMETVFQGRKRGGPNKNVVHNLLTPWETLDADPLVGGRRESHGEPEVAISSGRQNEGGQSRGFII